MPPKKGRQCVSFLNYQKRKDVAREVRTDDSGLGCVEVRVEGGRESEEVVVEGVLESGNAGIESGMGSGEARVEDGIELHDSLPLKL